MHIAKEKRKWLTLGNIETRLKNELPKGLNMKLNSNISKEVACYPPASRAAWGRGFLHLFDPVLAPGVRHVNQ